VLRVYGDRLAGDRDVRDALFDAAQSSAAKMSL
jgi:hypothetical protein